MLGCGLVWLGVTTRRRLFLGGSLQLQYIQASRGFKKGIATDGTLPLDHAEDQMKKLEDDLKSDAYIQMLATSLRSCQITQLTLPKAMMFKMASKRTQRSEDSVLDRPIPSQEASEVKTLRKRRSRRYVLKEAKKDKQKALARAQRLLQHKVVTSITDKSQERFKEQLEQVKRQLADLAERQNGQLMPIGLTRESTSQARGIAQGRGIWCTLSKRVLAETSKRDIHKMLPSTSPFPANLSEVIQEGLEKRVLEEARLLLQRIREGSHNFSWLIRRLIGNEMRAMVQDGCIELRDGKQTKLACLLVKEGEMPALQQEIDVYNLQNLFSNETRAKEVKDAFQSIAIFLNKMLLKKRRQDMQPREARLSQDPNDNAEQDQKEKTESNVQIQGKKWPRVLAVKRDERTVNLCIALWRLDAWCQSG